MYQGPGRYQHRKGGVYRVLGLARDKQTGERTVIYETLDLAGSTIGDDDFWSRALDNFNAQVDGVERFTRLSQRVGGEGETATPTLPAKIMLPIFFSDPTMQSHE